MTARGRTIIAAIVFVLAMSFTVAGVGRIPPLGALLNPVTGAWALAGKPELPDEQVAIPGLKNPVKVIFDDRAVPHIFATTEEDAYRALGYVVARDRLFQMELQSRATAGTLTELIGTRAFPADSVSRALGLAAAADRKFAAMDKDGKSALALDAYADGVNAWIDRMTARDIPIEYRLLNRRPSRWEPRYTSYFLMRMSLTLGYNDASQRRLRMQSLVGAAAADALVPVNSPIQEPIQPNGQSAPRYDFRKLPPPSAPDTNALRVSEAREQMLDALMVFGHRLPSGDGVGSNNWAVAPSRSLSRHAILSGDPHLDLTLPSVWYEAHLSVPGKLDVAGVTFPGVPGIVIGFNRDIAWTFTNAQADVNDFYAETVDDAARPSKYLLDGTWLPLQKRVEKFRAPGGNVFRTDTTLLTHRGPMRKIRGRWLSLRWTALEPSGEMDCFIGAMHAKSVDEWLAAMQSYKAPIQNGLVADRGGNIAIRATGLYPVRPGSGRGDIFFDGSKSASDWKGFLPLEREPFAKNPSQGYLASANQQPIDPRLTRDYFGSDWYSPWRAMRINRDLRADSAFTPDKIRRMQLDPGSARADAFVPILLEAARAEIAAGRGDRELKTSEKFLAEWDRQYTKSSRQAAFFELVMDQVNLRTWDELVTPGDSARGSPVNVPEQSVLLELMSDPGSVWWDNRGTRDIVETRDMILAESMRAALRQGIKSYGDPGSAKWEWSARRKANIRHLLRINSFSRLGIPIQSGPSTIAPSTEDGVHGPSWRMVVELGPEIRAWGVYPGGQSGNPASAFYADRISKWSNGELDQLLFPKTSAQIPDSRISSRLELRKQ